MNSKKDKFSSRMSLRYRGAECLNCGHPLDKSDRYCPNCSQVNTNKHLSARDFFSEFLSSILVYDSRLRNTLKDLLFRPGVISKNFIKGQRLKYANPFRFFLSVSIIFFLMNGLLGTISNSERNQFLNLNTKSPNEVPLDSLLAHSPEQFTAMSKQDSLMTIQLGIPLYFSEKTLDSLSFLEGYSKRSSLYMLYAYHHNTQNSRTALEKLRHADTFINNWLYSRSITWNKILKDPNAFIGYMISKIPFFLFFFTPFYAVFFWLLYSKKKYTYMEHMIFIFHIFSFIFLAMLIFLVPDYYLDDFFAQLFFFLIGPIYFYLALRKFYGQGKLLTLIKFVLLSFIFNIGFFVATMLFVAASAAIY
ncbi:MAG TPA: DUF3667 domain-containing protein [Aequorivita sp.]|nr:DUF3667 domain-containing protein [Aequorivita sp.]